MNDCKSIFSLLCFTTFLTVHRIGDSAKNAFHSNPKNTVFDTKRLIGRKMDEPEVKRDLKHLPFTVKGKNNRPMINVKYSGENREFVSGFYSSALFIVTNSFVDTRRNWCDDSQTNERDGRGLPRPRCHTRRHHCPSL